MRTVEVPAWLAVVVTLGVAFISAGGAISAQLVAAWRQRKRENTKWQRDRHTEIVRLRHEHADQWREMKVKTYGLVLMKLRAAESLLATMGTEGGASFEEAYQEYRDILVSLGGDVAEVELICSSQVEEFIHATENKQKVTLLSMPPNLSTIAQTGDALHVQVRRHRELVKIGREYRRGFLAAARAELGVDAPGIADPA